MSPDETGWNVAGTLHWLWAFATPETTVYAIRPGRGFGDAVTILGADFAGVLARDGWAPCRRFVHADHHTCLAQYADLEIMPRPARTPASRAVPALKRAA